MNSDYCNFADDNENCYLLTSANRNRDCYYGFLSVDNRSIVDTLWCTASELLYECCDCRGCYNVHHLQNCEDCRDSAFLRDCRGCSRCFLCIGLRRKENYILNRPCTKEEVDNFIASLSGSHQAHQRALQHFDALLQSHPIRRAVNAVSCEDVTGDNLFQCRSVHLGFDVFESRDCANLHDGLKAIDCQDICFFDQTELCYESTSLMGHGYRFTMFCRDSSDLFYCDNCHGCRDCFGCVGLRKKQYCILNRQYTPEAYECLAAEIVAHMRATREWGEFFSTECSPFAYNDTLAQEIFPLGAEEATKQGWAWRFGEEEVPKVSKIIPAEKLPDRIDDIPDDIVNWAIECEATKRPFRIIKQELEFFRRMRLPVTHFHPDERHKRRMALRNPRHLWSRKCQKCGKGIETTYAPERPEVVYCEECYLKEVY
ncbi:MAG: hypothetical protein PHX87_02855 [Candidatus Peribacteraceae bacterium]|nr:hypothetical protein [Candidatus Peribacteraceae bacterium]MDD5742348.1 hypothetical protein [Candidatus Peribacteraceae bacterium]